MAQLNRTELYDKIMPLIRTFDMVQVKKWMAERYRVTTFQKLTVEEVADFKKFLETKKGP